MVDRGAESAMPLAEIDCGGTDGAEISTRVTGSSIGSGTGRAGTIHRGSSGESGSGGASFSSERPKATSSSGNGMMNPGRDFAGFPGVDFSIGSL